MALEENGGGLTKQWVVMESGSSDYESDFIESDSEDLNDSVESSSSEMAENNESSSASSSSYGPLYGLSDLMAQLPIPIKRGLSKFYQGKSESFASLASVGSLEDLAKKETSYSCRQRMKPCKSYGGGFDGLKLCPKPTIAKKPCLRSSIFSRFQKDFQVGCMSPNNPVQKQC